MKDGNEDKSVACAMQHSHKPQTLSNTWEPHGNQTRGDVCEVEIECVVHMTTPRATHLRLQADLDFLSEVAS